MDSPSISFANSPGAVLPGAALALSSGGADPVRGADFANLFKHLMDPAGRQELAADLGPGFQSLPLSPNIDVITADQPLPDNASLLAFARSQGLDDGMLKTLFAPGGQAGPDTQTLAVAMPLSVVGPLAIPLAQTGTLPAQGSLQPVRAQADDGLVQPDAQPTPEQAQLAASLGQVLVQELSVSRLPGVPLAQLAQAHHQVGPAPAAVLLAEPTLAGPAGLVLARTSAVAAMALSEAVPAEAPDAAQDVQLGLPLAKPAKSTASATAPTAATGLAGLAVSDTESLAVRTSAQAAPVQAMQEGLRLRLQPQERITQRLAAMAATGEQAVWGKISSQSAAEVEALVLGLAADWTFGDALAGEAPVLPQGLHGASQSEGQRASLGAPHQTTPAVPTSTAADRVANYEQLAQRLGQALGERLQAQIERGEWKVRMQVDPVSLGRIEMELNMRDGGLDAVFRSDNQATRDLIAQGLPRLRESLSQSGTAVANVWVQGDSSRQSGGNPTPWRGSKPGQAEGQAEDDVKLTPATAAERAATSDWDLMA